MARYDANGGPISRFQLSTRPTGRSPAGDLEAAYHLGGWSLLLDEFDEPPDAQLEDFEELIWERREAAAARLRLLTAVSKLSVPGRDVLRAYLTSGLQIEVQAALFNMSRQTYWHHLVTAARNLLSELTAELLALLPAQILDAVADDAKSATALMSRRRPQHTDAKRADAWRLTDKTCWEVA